MGSSRSRLLQREGFQLLSAPPFNQRLILWNFCYFTACDVHPFPACTGPGSLGLQLARSPTPHPLCYGEPLKRDMVGQGRVPPTSSSYPMAIMSASFVSPVLRCSRDVTSLGGMAVPTFQVTTVMLGRRRRREAQTNTRAPGVPCPPLQPPAPPMELSACKQWWPQPQLRQGAYTRSSTLAGGK